MRIRNYLSILLILFLIIGVMLSLSSCSCEHDWEDIEVYKEASCVETGKARSTCKICGITKKRELPKGEHQGKVVVLPTCTKEGYSTIDCPICGHCERVAVYPPIGHKEGVESIFCIRCQNVASCESYFTNLIESAGSDALHFRVEGLYASESIYISIMEMVIEVNTDGLLVGEGFARLGKGDDATEVDAFIYEDTVYLYNAEASGYHVIPLSLLVGDLETDIPDAPEVPENITVSLNDLAAFWEAELLPILRMGETIGDEELNITLSKIVKSLFDVWKYQGYTFHLRADKITALNDRLATEPLADFIDKQFGVGTFDRLEAALVNELSRTLSDVILNALADGVTVEELAARLDLLAEFLTGSEDMTFSSLVSEITGDEGFDLIALLNNKELMSRTVADVIAESAEQTMTGSELISEIKASFGEMKEKSLYQLAEIPEEQIGATKDAYNAQIEAIFGLFAFHFKGSAEGELLEVSVTLPLDGVNKTRFTLFFGEYDTPSVGNVPEKVSEMLGALKVENGTRLEGQSSTTGGVNTIKNTAIEFVSDEDGNVISIRSFISVITYEWSGKTEEMEHNGRIETAWLFDAVEEIYVFELSPSDVMELSVTDRCCGWGIYTFYKTMPVQYTKNTFTIYEIWEEKIFGDVLTSESMEATASNTVGFWFNEYTGEVRIDNDFDEHEYVYEKTVEGESCQSEGYELWGCKECDKEEKRNLLRGPHIPMDGRPYCSICGWHTFNPDDALYIYNSETDDTYVELFDGGEAVGYIELDGEYEVRSFSWKEEDGQIILFYFWNDRVLLVLPSDAFQQMNN